MSESIELSQGYLVAQRYTIERCLGTGGMGSVYLAHDAYLDGQSVAMKVLHPDLVADDKQTQRFLREVQLMRRVEHPNVVRTFDVGSDREIVFFTMEYVPGKPLESFIERRNFPLEQIPNLIIQVCSGLEAIHKAGIIHRDLKPANIIVTDEFFAKITDFGVARPEYSELTAHNEIIGSALYISPEVWLGTKLSPSVDLYSFGVLLYEITTGTLPFDGDTPAALMRMHLEYKPSPPKELNPKLVPWVSKLILHLLEKSAQDRPRDAREVIEYVKLQLGESTGKEVADDFLSQLEEQAVSSTPETFIEGVRFGELEESSRPTRAQSSPLKFLALGAFCTLGIGALVGVLRGALFPELSRLISDPSLLADVELVEAPGGFLALLALQVLLLGAFLPVVIFSTFSSLWILIVAQIGSLVILLGLSSLLLLSRISELGTETLNLRDSRAFSFLFAMLREVSGIFLLDPVVRRSSALELPRGWIYLPDSARKVSEAPASFSLIIFYLALLSSCVGACGGVANLTKFLLRTGLVFSLLFLLFWVFPAGDEVGFLSVPPNAGALISYAILIGGAYFFSTLPHRRA